MSGNILVVEDNDFVRMQIVRYLTDAGFSVQEASNGKDALTVMTESADAVDAAIVDVRMEPVDGFDFVKALRGRGVKTPVLLVTGDNNPDLLSEAQRWGIAAVLMKPVQKDRLVKMVTRTVETRRKSS